MTATKGDKSATVSWSAPTTDGGTPITSYTVTSSPGGITKTVTGDQTTATITGLTNGTSYTFTVVATNATGTSPASTPSNAVIPSAAPGAPTSVSAAKADKSATVSWTAPTDNGGSPITGYTITSTPGGITKTVTGDQTTATITGLTNGTSYTFTVAATNATGTSPASTPSNAVIPSAAPGAPTSVSAAKADKSATVSWTAPTDNGGSPITGYTITSTPGGITKTVTGDQPTATITGLTNGTSYTFTVAATNATGTSPASAPSNVVTPSAPAEPEPEPEPVTAPAAPTDAKAKVKKRNVVLAWSAPEAGDAPTGYRVASNKGYEKTLPAGTTKLVVRKLKPGKYTFFIASENEAGISDPVRLRVRVR
ncbi:hypothetical protein GCM10027270_02710 [Nocardioides ginkgobilobae]